MPATAQRFMLAAGGLLALSHGISILPSIPAGRRRWEREEAPLLHRIRISQGLILPVGDDGCLDFRLSGGAEDDFEEGTGDRKPGLSEDAAEVLLKRRFNVLVCATEAV